jgi:DNA-binding CsgD family transcriptional regulator
VHDLAKLIVRRVPSEDRWLLLVSEESGEAIARRLERFGLTPREREVLRWRILAKLGAENRTAAALIVHGVNS